MALGTDFVEQRLARLFVDRLFVAVYVDRLFGGA
jgi:hypothetical protein